jgi:putative N-acetylmannosamine-6-phosphate epimerase
MYFNKDYKGTDDFDSDLIDDKRYIPEDDKDVIELDDTRKTRLTLKQINQMRKNYEAHMSEIAEESELIQAQYATPVQQPQ